MQLFARYLHCNRVSGRGGSIADVVSVPPPVPVASDHVAHLAVQEAVGKSDEEALKIGFIIGLLDLKSKALHYDHTWKAIRKVRVSMKTVARVLSDLLGPTMVMM